MELKSAGPPHLLIDTLTRVLPCPELPDDVLTSMRSTVMSGAAVRAVATACARLEATLLCELPDEDAVAERIGPLSERASLLLELRFSRCRLVVQ